MRRPICLFCALGLLVTACTRLPEPGVNPNLRPAAEPAGHVLSGVASWYGGKFHGRRTANGEIYDMHLLTAAHKTLPFHSLVRVTRLDNGRTVTVRINDRGPFVAGRIIDLSFAAARRLGMEEDGTARVGLQILAADQAPIAEVDSLVRVQAGAFSRADNAAARARVLAARLGEDFEVITDGPWHRVLSAPLSRGRGETLCRRLRESGIEAFIRESW